MFTVEEGTLLRRMLRFVGLVAVCLFVAVVWFVLRRFHPFHHMALTMFSGGGCVRNAVAPTWGLFAGRRGKAKRRRTITSNLCGI